MITGHNKDKYMTKLICDERTAHSLVLGMTHTVQVKKITLNMSFPKIFQSL